MFPRVLVVEDDGPIRALLVTALRRVGLEVEEAGDGAEALEMLAARSFGLMLIDLMMPRMDGYALIDEISRMSFERRPIVIVMTAFPDASVHHLNPHVVHAFLRKPFDLEMMVGMIQDAARELEGSGPPDAPAAEVRTPAS